MSLIYIGKFGKKKVFITPYSQKRLLQRNLSRKEVLQVLQKRDISYPSDKEGRQKIRSTLGKKQAFLTVVEDAKKVVVITGGDSNAPA